MFSPTTCYTVYTPVYMSSCAQGSWRFMRTPPVRINDYESMLIGNEETLKGLLHDSEKKKTMVKQ